MGSLAPVDFRRGSDFALFRNTCCRKNKKGQVVSGTAANCIKTKPGAALAASAQENIRRKKQILHRILRSGGLPYVSMPSPSRLGSAQNLRFSDANSFANMFYIKSLPHSVYGGDFFRFNPTSKKSLAKPHVFLCGGSFRGAFFVRPRRKKRKNMRIKGKFALKITFCGDIIY